MNMIRLTAIPALLLLAGAAAAADKSSGPELKAAEASIPFADMRHSIRDWQADGTQGLWIQDMRRNWYYAKLLGPCFGLDFATTIGFKIGPGTGSLDKFSAIVVPEYDRCQFTSLTQSQPPPPKNKDKSGKASKAEQQKPIDL